ncbi:hypothetical protein PENTCL1PPCAC_3044, partial [Pristionchus entomophagus]
EARDRDVFRRLSVKKSRRRMIILSLLIALLGVVQGEKLLFAQMIWRHGLRTPIGTYTNDPYNEDFFGVPDGELLETGMEQHFIRGQQLRKIYVEDHKLISAKYSRYETYVRSADFERCSQSALANIAGFYADSPTYPTGVSNWPSSWTPIPIHTVPHDEDHILEGFDHICPKLTKLEDARRDRKEFQNFLASKWPLFYTINANSGDPADYSFMTLAGMYQSLEIEKSFNLTFPDWVTDEFFNELEAAWREGHDYLSGDAGFGLPMDPEMVKLASGFLFKDWMDNIDDVINGNSTLKYYAYSGHDIMMNSILFGLGVKRELVGSGNADYASTIVCELWERDGQHFIKLLLSPDIDSDFEPFTRKLTGCGSDLCLLTDFKNFMKPFIADDVKICDGEEDFDRISSM